MNRNSYKIAFVFYFIAAFALYFKAIKGGWYFDDYTKIYFNYSLGNIKSQFLYFFSPRSIAYLTFGINYKISALNADWYRVVNIFIHIVNSFLVFILFSLFYGDKKWLAFAAGLLFMVHPVQTQPVNYVVQRMTLLSCLFFLLALLLFVFALKKYIRNKNLSVGLLCLSLLCGIFSVTSKENTVLLPFLISVFVFYLCPEKYTFKQKCLFVLPFLLIPLYAVALQFSNHQSIIRRMDTVPFFTGPSPGGGLYTLEFNPDRLGQKYLLSQLQVFWVYLKLLFFPINQALDYCWPLPPRFSGWSMWLSVVSLPGLGYYGIVSRKKRPLVFFALAWIFLTIIVESGPIPLDPIFEHRLYLPLVGVILLFMELVANPLPPKAQILLFVCLGLAFSWLSWQRNVLWGNPIAFWEDNSRVVPLAPRPKHWLAHEYVRAGRYAEAVNELDKLLPGDRDDFYKSQLAEALFHAGQEKRAFDLFRQIEKADPYDNNLILYQGVSAFRTNDIDRARNMLDLARKKNSGDPRAYYYLGLIDESTGDLFDAAINLQEALKKVWSYAEISPGGALRVREKATEARTRVVGLLREALARKQHEFITSRDMKARVEFTNVLLMIGNFDQALENYKRLISIAPNLWFLHYDAGIASEKLGRFDEAEAYFIETLRLNPENALVLNNLGDLYLKLDRPEKAKEVLLRAVQLDPQYAEAQLNLAICFYGLGDKNLARDRFYLVSKVFPAHARKANSYLRGLKF